MAEALRNLAPNLWIADQHFPNGPVDVATRMTVIRLRDGGLFLHSPVRLDPELRRALDSLGPVKAVVAPNRHHHLFAADYPAGYPDAVLYAAPGLAEKRSDLKFAAELSDSPPAAWAGSLEQLLFRGAPFLSEVVFFHPESRTVLFTDLVFNVPAGQATGMTRWFFRVVGAEGRFGPHRLVRYLFIRDRAAARESVERILRWDFERVVVTHGDVLESGGRERVRAAFSFLR
jgi:uncharacterized protein DUF4336